MALSFKFFSPISLSPVLLNKRYFSSSNSGIGVVKHFSAAFKCPLLMHKGFLDSQTVRLEQGIPNGSPGLSGSKSAI